jgi:hypothetical protein
MALVFGRTGEVSDSGSASGSDEDDEDKFYDGYDENLIGDAEDRQRLEQMTEKEREQELFNRMERRQVLKTRSVAATILSCLRFVVVVSKLNIWLAFGNAKIRPKTAS